jgi:hypothetical protein
MPLDTPRSSPAAETLMAENRRGAALVAELLRAHRGDDAFRNAKPMTAAALQAVTPSIPPSLATWLAFDVRSPSGEVSLVEGKKLALRSTEDLFEELVVSESEGEDWEEDTRAAMKELAATVPGDALLLREPCGQDHFLYLGKQIEGECVVLGLEDEELFVAWSGFDTYVADQLGALKPRDPAEKKAKARAAKLLFGA